MSDLLLRNFGCKLIYANSGPVNFSTWKIDKYLSFLFLFLFFNRVTRNKFSRVVYRVSGKRFCQGLKFVTANFIGGYKLLILDTCWTLRNLDVNRFTRVPAIPIFFIPDFVSMYPMYLLITRRVITRNSLVYILFVCICSFFFF